MFHARAPALVRTTTRGHPMTSRTPPDGSFVVLVVEDEQDRAALLQAAFAYRDMPCALHVTGSSEEAIDYLLGRWPFDNRTRHPLPGVIILDLGLPRSGGLEFLRWFGNRRDPWSMTPVVVFTSDTNRALATQAFALGAKEVKIKPTDFTELVEIVEDVLRRWKANTA